MLSVLKIIAKLLSVVTFFLERWRERKATRKAEKQVKKAVKELDRLNERKRETVSRKNAGRSPSAIRDRLRKWERDGDN